MSQFANHVWLLFILPQIPLVCTSQLPKVIADIAFAACSRAECGGEVLMGNAIIVDIMSIAALG